MIVLLLVEILLLSICSAHESRCSLPKDPGSCQMSVPAIYYNKRNERCEVFAYSGCQGNDNRFDSLKECQETCHNYGPLRGEEDLNISVRNDYCMSPPLRSEESCSESLQMFTFNYESLSCESYVYGGCNGSPNLFESMDECMEACVHGKLKINKICELPPVEPNTDTCFGNFPSWTYNSALEECVSFIYEGCGATDNIFEVKKDCERVCL